MDNCLIRPRRESNRSDVLFTNAKLNPQNTMLNDIFGLFGPSSPMTNEPTVDYNNTIYSFKSDLTTDLNARYLRRRDSVSGPDEARYNMFNEPERNSLFGRESDTKKYESRYEVPESRYEVPESKYERPESKYEKPQSKYDIPEYERQQSKYERPQSKYHPAPDYKSNYDTFNYKPYSKYSMFKTQEPKEMKIPGSFQPANSKSTFDPRPSSAPYESYRSSYTPYKPETKEYPEKSYTSKYQPYTSSYSENPYSKPSENHISSYPKPSEKPTAFKSYSENPTAFTHSENLPLKSEFTEPLLKSNKYFNPDPIPIYNDNNLQTEPDKTYKFNSILKDLNLADLNKKIEKNNDFLINLNYLVDINHDLNQEKTPDTSQQYAKLKQEFLNELNNYQHFYKDYINFFKNYQNMKKFNGKLSAKLKMIKNTTNDNSVLFIVDNLLDDLNNLND